MAQTRRESANSKPEQLCLVTQLSQKKFFGAKKKVAFNVEYGTDVVNFRELSTQCSRQKVRVETDWNP